FLKKHPYSRIAMRLSGNVFANRGEIKKSIEMYQECLRYYPDDGLAQDSLNIMLKYNNNNTRDNPDNK
ncbi:MAG: tetratricopeptide repeat protein, partial [Candidatus Hydrogenedens sp.]